MADIASDLKSNASGVALWTRGKWVSVFLIAAVLLTILRYGGLLPEALASHP